MIFLMSCFIVFLVPNALYNWSPHMAVMNSPDSNLKQAPRQGVVEWSHPWFSLWPWASMSFQTGWQNKLWFIMRNFNQIYIISKTFLFSPFMLLKSAKLLIRWKLGRCNNIMATFWPSWHLLMTIFCWLDRYKLGTIDNRHSYLMVSTFCTENQNHKSFNKKKGWRPYT